MILFISDPRDDYQDTVFYAMRKTFGEKVVTFPRKPGFYGPTYEAEHYRNCYYNFPDCNISMQDILNSNIEAVFVISSGYPIHSTAKQIIKEIIDKKGKTWPLVIIDGGDPEHFDYNQELANYPCKFDLYFKRELLDYREYIPSVKPLPFCIIPEKFPLRSPVNKDIPTFFRGYSTSPDRQFFIDGLSSQYPGSVLSSSWHAPAHLQDRIEYFNLIDRTKVNLNIVGTGYDCIRFWEILGCGGFLLSQRMPQLVLPHFEEHKHLEYFSCKKEMLDKIKFYIQHDALRDKIALQGKQFTYENHSCYSRMNYILQELKNINFTL